MKKSKNGFTLAEVLITLVIIGVIGALTVPALIQNTQKQEYVSALKKAYSTLSQAAQQIIAEEGSPKCDNGGWLCSVDDLYNMYKKHLSILKDCGSGAGCFYNGVIKHLKDSGGWNINTDKDLRKIILSDGMEAAFQFYSGSCSHENLYGTEQVCSAIVVDTNGNKGPNQAGRDVFRFGLKENGLYPLGCDIDGYCEKSESFGWGCACRVLNEGAMNY